LLWLVASGIFFCFCGVFDILFPIPRKNMPHRATTQPGSTIDTYSWLTLCSAGCSWQVPPAACHLSPSS
jgi:hypothetical protein